MGVSSSANTNGIVARLATTSPASTTSASRGGPPAGRPSSSEMSEPSRLRDHEQARLKRRAAADRLPVQREQEEHPEHERAERPAIVGARAEPAVGEQAEVQQRLAAPPARMGTKRRRARGRRRASPSRRRVHPAAGRGPRQAVGQQRRARAAATRARDVQAPARDPCSCGSIRTRARAGRDTAARRSRTASARTPRRRAGPPSTGPSVGPLRFTSAKTAQDLAEAPRVERRTTIAWRPAARARRRAPAARARR